MREIKLTQGKVALVDDVMFEYINQFVWSASKHGNSWYAIRNPNNISPIRKMHRMILNVTDRNILVDHKDGDGLNNQRDNLRIANKSLNGMNAGIRSDNKSGYKGVGWKKDREKWIAYIRVNKKLIFVGYFDNIEDAIIARNQAELKYHGEFARLNFNG